MTQQVTKTRKKGRLAVILVIELFILIVLFAAFKVYSSLGKIHTDNSQDSQIQKNENVVTDTGYRNIVIFGVDSRENSLTKGTHSDTIIIASLNKKTKDVKLASIYRDTFSSIPEVGYKKINAAYFDGGYSLALSTVNRNFDLDISEYVTVNFAAVVDAIDLIGGITLDVTADEIHYLNGYVNELNRINGTNVPHIKSTGTQLLNGTQATAYARIRYTSGADFKRTERQRTVIGKVFAKVKDSNLATINAFISKVFPEVSTNLGKMEILGLAKDVFAYNIKDDTGFPFEKDAHTYDGVSYVFPINLADNVTKLHKFLFGETGYVPSANVQNYSDYIEGIRKK